MGNKKFRTGFRRQLGFAEMDEVLDGSDGSFFCAAGDKEIKTVAVVLGDLLEIRLRGCWVGLMHECFVEGKGLSCVVNDWFIKAVEIVDSDGDI